MNALRLEKTAQSLVPPGKGILAADESLPTIKKRFRSIDLASTNETRRRYRELLLSTPELQHHISGVILFDETLHQQSGKHKPLIKVLSDKGILPGIKVDQGTTPLPFFPRETITQGLDGLGERCEKYQHMGARFTKWRAVIKIGDGRPSAFAIEANAHALARFAAISQQAGLVPVVEPEVLMEGTHSLARCEEVTMHTLNEVFSQLHKHQVHLEGMLLKASMVLPGSDYPQHASEAEVAEATTRVLLRTVPAAVPGIVFLSGGQSPTDATRHLNAINRMGHWPWQLSFSYGRALQEPALDAWRGIEANVAAAEEALLARAQLNGAAQTGTYYPVMEKTLALQGAT